MSNISPFARPVYVMLKPVGSDATWLVITVIIWRRTNFIRM